MLGINQRFTGTPYLDILCWQLHIFISYWVPYIERKPTLVVFVVKDLAATEIKYVFC